SGAPRSMGPGVQSTPGRSGLILTQVNIPAASGDMDILAAHMPSVEELKPDLVATRHRSVRPPSDDFLNKYINRDWLPSTTLSALTSLRKDSLRTDSPTVKRLLPIPAPSSPAFQAFTKPYHNSALVLVPEAVAGAVA
ncbi:hypothetical protein A4X03_0g6687, partial [Tilletia caries]